MHLKFFWYFQTAQFPSLAFCACCRHLKFDYEDPDKAERMLIRAARFGNQLQSPSRRKQTLTLTINTMSVCLPSFVCLWLCEHQKHKLHEKKRFILEYFLILWSVPKRLCAGRWLHWCVMLSTILHSFHRLLQCVLFLNSSRHNTQGCDHLIIVISSR